jgi:hypothetical protein
MYQLMSRSIRVVLLSDGTVCRELTAATPDPDPLGGTGSKDWGSGARILRGRRVPLS